MKYREIDVEALLKKHQTRPTNDDGRGVLVWQFWLIDQAEMVLESRFSMRTGNSRMRMPVA